MNACQPLHWLACSQTLATLGPTCDANVVLRKRFNDISTHLANAAAAFSPGVGVDLVSQECRSHATKDGAARLTSLVGLHDCVKGITADAVFVAPDQLEHALPTVSRAERGEKVITPSVFQVVDR